MGPAGDIWQRLDLAVRRLDDPPCGRGWNHLEMQELLGETPRRAAAVLVGVVERDAGPSVLLTQRTHDMPHHAGQISFPGGGMQSDDADVIATALRETREEVGIVSEQIRPIGFLDSFETISGYCVTPVVARLERACHIVPDPREVAEVFEAPLAFFLEPGNLRWRRRSYRGREREIPEFRLPGRIVWGATAAILQNLTSRMCREESA